MDKELPIIFIYLPDDLILTSAITPDIIFILSYWFTASGTIASWITLAKTGGLLNLLFYYFPML